MGTVKWFVSCENAIILGDNHWSSFNATQQLMVHPHTSQQWTSFCTHTSQKHHLFTSSHIQNEWILTEVQHQPHVHTCQITPGIVSNIWQTGFCLLLHLSSCPLLDPSVVWWITCSLGWIPPHTHTHTPHPLCHFTRSSVPIPHPQGPFVTYVGPVIRQNDIRVCIWPHKRHPDPRSRLQMGRRSFVCPFFCKQMSF